MSVEPSKLKSATPTSSVRRLFPSIQREAGSFRLSGTLIGESYVNWNVIESVFGAPAPNELVDLHSKVLTCAQAPVEFRFENVRFVVEVQYFLDIEDPANHEPDKGLLAFAVTSDGDRLLIDLKAADLPILQEELGTVDSIGLTIGDLLVGRPYSLIG